jgi:hypothetical protein
VQDSRKRLLLAFRIPIANRHPSKLASRSITPNISIPSFDTAKRHILADQHPDANYGGEAHASVVAVADADRKPAARHAGVEVEHAEHLHTVLADGVFLGDYADVTEV